MDTACSPCAILAGQGVDSDSRTVGVAYVLAGKGWAARVEHIFLRILFLLLAAVFLPSPTPMLLNWSPIFISGIRGIAGQIPAPNACDACFLAPAPNALIVVVFFKSHP